MKPEMTKEQRKNFDLDNFIEDEFDEEDIDQADDYSIPANEILNYYSKKFNHGEVFHV